MPNASQITSDLKGDHLSVRMFGAKGDGVIITDAAMGIGSGNLSSASSAFTSAITGKIIAVKGAGASGATLYGTISSVTGLTTLVVSVAASTNVTGATAAYGTDDTVAIQNGIDSNRQLFLPIGNFIVTGQLVMADLTSFRFYGEGWPSCLVPAAHITNNLIDCSGSNDIEFDHFQVNGALYPDVSAECIFGDGTTANPSYGNARVHHCFFNHWGPLCLGIGANSDTTAHTVSTVEYHHNYFYDCGYGSFGPNVIDTGSSGVKTNFSIHDNIFQFVTYNTTLPPNAIFMGHGVMIGFDCHNNLITGSPTTGIAIYNRSFSTEATVMIGINVHDNVIINPKWNGISNFGGSNVKICGNVIINPGQALLSTTETRVGIYLSDGSTGGIVTTVQAVNVKVSDNLIVDTQTVHTMRYGIFESLLGSVATDGTVTDNVITGYLTADMLTLGSMAIMRRTTGTNFQIGMATNTEALNIIGESRSESVNGAALFVQTMIRSAVSAGNFLLGYGLNLRYNGTNFVSGFDGSSNGFAAMLTDYGTGIVYLLSGAKTGGTSQTIAPASILGKTFLRYDPVNNQMILSGNVAALLSMAIGLSPGTWAAAGYSLDISGGHVRIQGANTLAIGGNQDGNPLTVYGGGKFRGTVELTTGTIQLDALSGGGTQSIAVNNSGQIVVGGGGGGVTSLTIANSGTGGPTLSPAGGPFAGAISLTLTQPAAWPGAWTLVLTASAGSVTVITAVNKYEQQGKTVRVRIYAQFTVSTTCAFVSINPPVIPISLGVTYGQGLSLTLTTAGFAQMTAGCVIRSSVPDIVIFGVGPAAFTSGNTYEAIIGGDYEAA